MARVRCTHCEGTGRSGIGKSYEVNCSYCYGSGWVDESDSSSSASAAARAKNDAKNKAEWEALYEDFNKMVRALNAGKWDEVIKQEWVANSDSTYNMYGKVLPDGDRNKAVIMAGIARANRDDDYQAGFEAGWSISYANDSKILCPAAIEAGKKAWERKNGRAISQDEFNRIHIECLEIKMVKRLDNQRKFEGLVSKDEDAQEWMSLTGKKLSVKEQKRIYGKIFLDKERRLMIGMGIGFFVIVAGITAYQFFSYVESDPSVKFSKFYQYSINETDDGVIINYYSNIFAFGKLQIPAEISGLPVVGIKDFASSADNLFYSSVVFPDTVTFIGANSFQDHRRLKQVTLPQNLKVIDSYAFNLTGLTSVDIPDGVEEIREGAFKWCNKLKTVTLPASIKIIGKDAFFGCDKLSAVSKQAIRDAGYTGNF